MTIIPKTQKLIASDLAELILANWSDPCCNDAELKFVILRWLRLNSQEVNQTKKPVVKAGKREQLKLKLER